MVRRRPGRLASIVTFRPKHPFACAAALAAETKPVRTIIGWRLPGVVAGRRSRWSAYDDSGSSTADINERRTVSFCVALA